MDAGQRELLARYVDAFERFDVEELVGLLHKDAVQSMPPVRDVAPRVGGYWPLHARPRPRLPRVEAGGHPSQRLASVRSLQTRSRGRLRPVGHRGARIFRGPISGIHSFLEADRLFPQFGLPLELSA